MPTDTGISDHYRMLFERSADAILIIADETFIDCNAAAVRMLGANSREEIVGKPPTLISPEYQPNGQTSAERAAELFPKAIADGSLRFEWIHTKLDGTEFWAEVTLTTFEVDGELRIQSQWKDITDRKEAEQQLQVAADVIDGATDGMIVALPDGTIEFANKAWYDLLGYDSASEEMVGMNLSEVWPEEEVGILVNHALPEAIQSGWRGEAAHVRKDGSIFDVSITLFPLAVVDGEATRIGQIVRDITEQKMVEETIRQQSEAILDMSTPVIRVWDDILLMPLIGIVDTSRAQQILETLLEEIVSSESQIVILDVTGVPVIDTSIARNLMKTVEAARMLGAEVIITGFSPDAAQTLTQLNVDFTTLRTKGSLKAGMGEAFSLIRRAAKSNGN